ncbi:MAG TPA: Gfo/Idh/MocA family oxidoreductase [Pseudolysinimonas sp.]
MVTADVVRWGVVGTGGIGRRTVGDLRLCDTARVVAVASRSQDSADAFASEWELPFAFGDFDDLCASPDVDAVYIGTPHSTHYSYARRALGAGKHVLCEKPLTMTADEAAELGSIAADRGLFLMEAMWMKFSPAVRHAVKLVEDGVIGEPRFLQSGLGYPVPADGPPRFWDAALGGGALYDMGVYTIALAHLLFGERAAVSASGSVRPDGVDLDETYLVDFVGGQVAQSVTSITFFVPPRAWLGGTKGSIEFDAPLFSPRSLTVTTGTPPTPPAVETIEFAVEGAGYVPMFRAVNDAILAGHIAHPIHPVAATVQTLRTMEAIRDALLAERDRD